VKHGEVLGIIGRNGAGKSTLLKILSRITAPTEGTVDLYGRVGSLLEVGTGFHPELTGRENIYLNGAILGMTRAEIDRRFDEIVAFAELEKFLDTPVKHYSSGMYVRLAFAVAAHLEPEILLVDEVLAVGDAAFQKKCLGKMGEVAGEGRTVLFVSHNMRAIHTLCTNCILLHDSIVSKHGPAATVINAYLALTDSIADSSLDTRKDRRGNGFFRFRSVRFTDDRGEVVDSVSTGQKVSIHLDYACQHEVNWDSIQVSVGFRDRLGQFLFNCPSNSVTNPADKLKRQGTLVCTFPRFPLPDGEYQFNLFSQINQEITDWIQGAGVLQIESGDFYQTGKLLAEAHRGVLVDFEWKIL
jgi:lipopolysaccharide transport system ATP-binding protein